MNGTPTLTQVSKGYARRIKKKKPAASGEDSLLKRLWPGLITGAWTMIPQALAPCASNCRLPLFNRLPGLSEKID
jgi:hypothetical protein